MIQGRGVAPGIGIARAFVWRSPIPAQIEPPAQVNAARECARFDDALRVVYRKNIKRAQAAARRIGRGESAIFKAHCCILEDEENIRQPIYRHIMASSLSAECAVTLLFNSWAETMIRLENEYMRQRAEDFLILKEQLLHVLLGLPELDGSCLTQPVVVIAHHLFAAEITSLNLKQLVGIICETGSPFSHSAILARTLHIPAIIDAKDVVAKTQPGDMVALDGNSGEVWVSPQKRELATIKARHWQSRVSAPYAT